MSFETTYKLSQNTIDYVANQLKTIAEGLLGFSPEGDEKVFDNSYFFSGSGVAYVPIWCGRWCYAYYTADINVNQGGTNISSISLHSIPSDNIVSYVSNVNIADVTEYFYDYLSNSAWFFTSPPVSNSQNGILFYSDSIRHNPINNWGYLSDVSQFIYYNYINLSSYSSIPDTFNDDFIRAHYNTSNGYYRDFNFYPINNAVPFQNVSTTGTERTVVKGDNIYTYNYSSDKGVYFRSDGDYSYNDYLEIFNDYILPLALEVDGNLIEPNISFPNVQSLSPPPFAFIQPVHELNYSLELPDTSDYLDVQAISKPLSICSDILSYMWGAITSIGLAPVLGFCLVATLIVKGLRGD